MLALIAVTADLQSFVLIVLQKRAMNNVGLKHRSSP